LRRFTSASSRRRQASNSATSVTIGNMTESCAPAAGVHHGAQLLAQHRAGRSSAMRMARQAHRRILLRRAVQLRQHLVGADVEGAGR
jgi:hypothetical protein